MELPGIVELARSTCHFVRYQDGNIWYSALWGLQGTPEGTISRSFEFPIPVEDAGEGVFGPVMKGIGLMRWMRKHLDVIREAHEDRPLST